MRRRDLLKYGTAALSAPLLWNLIESVEVLRREVARLFTQVDLIVTPSAAALPWAAEEVFPNEIDGQPVGPRGHAVFTGWVNASGLPALAVPAEPSAEGLPIGIQMVADFGTDDALLSLGAAFESLAPWAHRWPTL